MFGYCPPMSKIISQDPDDAFTMITKTKCQTYGVTFPLNTCIRDSRIKTEWYPVVVLRWIPSHTSFVVEKYEDGNCDPLKYTGPIVDFNQPGYDLFTEPTNVSVPTACRSEASCVSIGSSCVSDLCNNNITTFECSGNLSTPCHQCTVKCICSDAGIIPMMRASQQSQINQLCRDCTLVVILHTSCVNHSN
jgi:hypothetical protein